MSGDQEMGSIPPPVGIPRQAHHHYFGHVYSQSNNPQYNFLATGLAAANVIDLGRE
jgi:hypothetical protein